MSAVNEMNVKNAITKIEFKRLGNSSIVGIAVLRNGIEIVESCSFRSAGKFNLALGEAIVKERIHHKIFELLGTKQEEAAPSKKQEAAPPVRKPGRPPKNAPAPVVLPDEDDDDENDEAFNG